jgi:hypothetical protein
MAAVVCGRRPHLRIYLAKDEAVIRKHAELSGFPASRIVEISKVIDPTTASQA